MRALFQILIGMAIESTVVISTAAHSPGVCAGSTKSRCGQR